jgi:hypothetical protein
VQNTSSNIEVPIDVDLQNEEPAYLVFVLPECLLYLTPDGNI